MATKIFHEFKQFALRGSVIDLAVGFTVGAAFSTIARSLVNDIIMPPIGLLIGQVDFSNLYLVLGPGAQIGETYATLEAARAAGAVTLNYGIFINNVVTFLLLALSMFALIRLINRFNASLEVPFATEAVKQDQALAQPAADKKCPFCISVIPHAASRCPKCTSDLGVPAA